MTDHDKIDSPGASSAAEGNLPSTPALEPVAAADLAASGHGGELASEKRKRRGRGRRGRSGGRREAARERALPPLPSKSKQLIVNASESMLRVAYLEDGEVVELHFDQGQYLEVVGNIYKGKVTRVLPGMQAAFVDIGIGKAAFLHVSDVMEELKALAGLIDDDTDEPLENLQQRHRQRHSARIQDHVRENDQIVVQVAKAPLGTKGAKVTQAISLPGRNIVFLPTFNHIGVSRRIEDSAERQRLRRIAEEMRGEGEGYIVRTAAEGVEESVLRGEAEFLSKMWEGIQKKSKRLPAPALVHQDLDLLLKAVRDFTTDKVDKIVLDSAEHHQRLKKALKNFAPELEEHLELYEGSEPIFDHFHIEEEVAKATQRKVWLKSGGYILIDPTEALTAIDVNTGRFVGKRSLDDTILKTNLEAVQEIVYQIRLRNIGGIIILDFIDMDRAEDRNKVYQALEEALRADRSRSKVLEISKMGLVEMTRKRTSQSLLQISSESCFYCEGKGYLKNRSILCQEILRQIVRKGVSNSHRQLTVSAHPQVAEMLSQFHQDGLETLGKKLRKKITVQPNAQLHFEKFELHFHD